MCGGEPGGSDSVDGAVGEVWVGCIGRLSLECTLGLRLHALCHGCIILSVHCTTVHINLHHTLTTPHPKLGLGGPALEGSRRSRRSHAWCASREWDWAWKCLGRHLKGTHVTRHINDMTPHATVCMLLLLQTGSCCQSLHAVAALCNAGTGCATRCRDGRCTTLL
jgi:hypothetical protein